MSSGVVSYIGLGSNLSEPKKQVVSGLNAIKCLPKTELIKFSSLYTTKPFGQVEQPDFINAVAKIHTELSPFVLLEKLMDIEAQHGRVRREQWGPRTLDLDIILYSNEVITTERLTIPHAGMKERPSVLYPLADIDSDLIFPDGTSLQTLLAHCSSDGIVEKQEETII